MTLEENQLLVALGLPRFSLENTIDTTNLSYWLNWRVLLCAVSVLLPLLIELLILWKHEGSRHLTPGKGQNVQDRNQSDEAWKPWVKEIHPVCLLVYRVAAFLLLLASFASMLSAYGCHQFQKSRSDTLNFSFAGTDAEQCSSTPLLHQNSTNPSHENRLIAILSYTAEVLFQMTVNMHTTNVVLLHGDTALNCLQLPWFRFSFFVLWTGAFVIFQWILHAFESIWWPYPFLDLSSRYAPLWHGISLISSTFGCYQFK